MKRTITTLALAASMMLLAIPAAFATHEGPPAQSQDTAGATALGEGECRPGADNDNVGPWALMTQSEFETEVEESRGLPDGAVDASATWDFCDKNRDGNLCVMKYTLPSGSPWLLLDNRPFK